MRNFKSPCIFLFFLCFSLFVSRSQAQTPTVSSLQATGTGVKWYSAPTGGILYNGTEALVDGQTYYASQTVNGCESTTRFAVTAHLNPAPSAPTAGTHTATETQIIWNWNTVVGATGYKWGTTNVYANATDMGTNVTKTENGLACSTAYSRYIWAYNASGCISVSTTLTKSTAACFTCGTSVITDSRDSKVYSTVLIGTQCWMAKNLNIGTRINGSGDQTDNSIIEKYCYNNSESACTEWGGLYQWSEMMQYVTTAGVKGICPTGWHLPTDGEWTTLSDYLGGSSDAGGKLKETGTSHWSDPNTGATNSSGFTAIGAGARSNVDGTFALGFTANYLWSSSQSFSNAAYYRGIFNNSSNFYSDNTYYPTGMSVRCLRDQ